jgi:RNA polymerase sigma-70 factor (ECF subfamily)
MVGAAVDEREAVARLKRGDAGGLQTLVYAYQAQAVRASFLICHDLEMAEDVVQTAFVQAYERIDQFDEGRQFGPWFLRSVVNSTLMVLRGQRTVSLVDVDQDFIPEAMDAMTPEAMIEAAETREAIWETLSRLSPGQRAAVVMRYYLDLSDAEISARLEVPPGTVRRRLHNARQRLRHLLPAWLGPGEGE